MQPNLDPVGTARSWWKPSPDTLAAYLTPQDVRRLIASAAGRAPADWQTRAKYTLGARLGRELVAAGRGVLSVATLGLSEIMFRLSTPGNLAAELSMPSLDLVVGPTEAALLIFNGMVEELVTADRVQTHDFWRKFDSLIARGPHLEIVMVDLAPVLMSLPIELEAAGEVLPGALDALVSIDASMARKAIGLVSWGKHFTVANPTADAKRTTFVSLAGLADRLHRHLQSQLPIMPQARVDARSLRSDASARAALQQACARFLTDQLFVFGMVARDVRLDLARGGEEDLAIRRRTADLERLRQDLVAEQQLVDRRRQEAVTAELQQIDTQEALVRGAADLTKAQAGEGNRLAVARMVLLNDQQLAEIQREGFAQKRASERTQETLDTQHQLLLAAQAHTASLERELAGARSGADIARIKMALETEQLKVAALAQEQNLLNLRRLREIEREDAQLRDRERAQLERERIAAMNGLTPEQVLAMIADKSPEVAKALSAKFANDGQHAQRSAAEQLALMQKMQAEMASLMRESLQANSQVARGMVQGAADIERARAVSGAVGPECRSCHARLQPQWRACPYCGAAV
jgi:hypothetical protein